jgi:hypothetical protein
MVTIDHPKATYPPDRKSSGHAVRFSKALFRSDAISRAGRDAVLLSLLVAGEEDRLHYSKPPQLWQAEIMRRLDLKSPKKLLHLRQRGVDAGFLHYYKGNRHYPGIYWTLVPDWLEPFYFKNSAGGILKHSQNSADGTSEASQNSAGGTLNGFQNSAGGMLSYTPLKSTPFSTHWEKPGEGGEKISREEEEARLDPALEAAP